MPWVALNPGQTIHSYLLQIIAMLLPATITGSCIMRVSLMPGMPPEDILLCPLTAGIRPYPEAAEKRMNIRTCERVE